MLSGRGFRRRLSRSLLECYIHIVRNMEVRFSTADKVSGIRTVSFCCLSPELCSCTSLNRWKLYVLQLAELLPSV